jgi:hypothetical protein
MALCNTNGCVFGFKDDEDEEAPEMPNFDGEGEM